MNLSARFKHSQHEHHKQPNYILNVNINIPLRTQNMLDSYRPLAGEFTFSPSQRSKRLKLEVASARTTHECESRKVSYLGETQNTISHRNNNLTLTNPSSRRRIITKSAFPSTQLIPKQQGLHLNKKVKSQSRSHAVSPNSHTHTAKKSNKKDKSSTHNNINTNARSQQLVHNSNNVNNIINSNRSKELIDLQHYIEHQQIEDNIIGYTNESSELGRDRLLRTNNSMKNYETHAVRQNKFDATFEDKCELKNAAVRITYKAESPMLEQQRMLIHDIREIQKTVQVKKQHLNYEYLKSKILVLASVKKIQRAWRNYTTRKLIKSYSNNISLKFTNKMKSELSMLVKGQQAKSNTDEGKILTVRSCGYGAKGNQMKKDNKRNLSQLYPREHEQLDEINTQSQKQQPKQEETKIIKKALKKEEKSAKSAIVKFQMEEIQRWEELIKHIKQGKKVEEVLEKSFRRKQELQKQLSNNLKDIGSSQNSEISIAKNQTNIQPVKDQSKIQADKQSEQNASFNKNKYVNQIGEVSLTSSDSQVQQKIELAFEPPNLLIKERKLKPFSLPIRQIKRTQRVEDYVEDEDQQEQEASEDQDEELEQDTMNNDSYDNEQVYDEEGATTKRRRKKLEYFENQIRKIDNQLSEGNVSYTESSQYEHSPQHVHIRQFNQAYEKEESEKLKKKLQALNKIELFNSKLMQQSEVLNNNAYLYTNLEQSVLKKTTEAAGHKKSVAYQKELEEQEEGAHFIPLTLNKEVNQNIKRRSNKQMIEQNDGPLETFRNRNFSDSSNRIIYEDLQANRMRRARKNKLKESEKDELANKIEEELLFDLLLEVSEHEQIIIKMQKLFEKPEGICTNLESIKDYLQNFVAFVFEQQPLILVESFNQPKGPGPLALLKTLRDGSDTALNQFSPVLSQHLFNQHWDYASQQIYFDVKYPNDHIKQQERVRYLKSITKMYFKAIFDGFNESLKTYRVYGQQGKPYPWEPNLRKQSAHLTLQQIKPLIRLGYRKLSQIAVIYCGLLFQDKKHSMSQKMIQDIQKERLDTLVEIELEQNEHKWESVQVETAEVYFRISQIITEILVLEVCFEMKGQKG